MSQYYVTPENTTNNNNSNNKSSNNNNNNNNLHTLLLMNTQNLPPQFDHHHSSKNNLLLLNSAAAAFAQPPFPHHLLRPDHVNPLYGYPHEEAAREGSRARQGLSLSLSSQNPGGGGGGGGGGGAGGPVSVFGSKYLRVAQELLEEVVNVGDTLMNGGGSHDQSPKKGKGVFDTPSGGAVGGDGGGDSGGGMLSTAERHEIQMKKAKLVTMLDEAEQRYRQYNNQMQIVIESFERAAGVGSAKTYTALALKTISKQFRCLKDAIQGQIRAANKSLGEDEGGSGSSAGKIQGSRLKFIDHQIRQQRALQQLGMIQNHNAWRPQRGLPERSVSVLRAWLFEHFLHPYPKDSDKILLAKQTGLTRSQVSNWFINARVRLWKPMIEEMYNEELKDQEQQMNSEDKENSNEDDVERVSNTLLEQEKININSETQIKPVKLDQQNNINNSSSSFVSIPTRPDPHYQQGFTLTGSLEMGVVSQQDSPAKRPRPNQMLSNNNGGEILIKFGDEKQEIRDSNGYHSITSEGGMNFIGGELGSYANIGDLGRFETEDFGATTRFIQGNNNGGISLSLGLPPSCDTHHQQHFNDLSSTSHHHHPFMSPPNQTIQFRRGNDFAAQLLPDFVALR